MGSTPIGIWNSMRNRIIAAKATGVVRVQERRNGFRVILKKNPQAKLPDPFIFHRKKRKKIKRPPTQWFLEHQHLMMQDSMKVCKNGTVHESAYWIEKETEEP